MTGELHGKRYWPVAVMTGLRVMSLGEIAGAHWELEHDLLAGQLPVHASVCVQLALGRVALLGVQVHLQDLSDTVACQRSVKDTVASQRSVRHTGACQRSVQHTSNVN